MSVVEVKNVGPIIGLSIPIPEDGGVVVLRGRNGSGKTHGIESVKALADKDARKRLGPTDGESGAINGLGVKVTLSRSTRASGEMQCDGLDGGYDPSTLVDPGIKDPAIADRHRMSSLCRLVGVTVSAEEWQSLLDGLDVDASLADLADNDPVDASDKVRRRIHELAMPVETRAEKLSAEADGLMQTVDENHLAVTVNIDAARKAHQDALVAWREMLTAQKSAGAVREKIEKASDAMAAIGDPSADIKAAKKELAAGAKAMAEKQSELKAVDAEIQSLRDRKQSIERDIARIDAVNEGITERIASLSDAQDRLDELVKIATSAIPECPTDAEVEAARAAITEREREVQLQTLAAKDQETAAKANAVRAEAAAKAKLAAELRERARSTDKVLEACLSRLGFDQLRVVEGRLCACTDRSDQEPFADLSPGERWTIALQVAATRLRPGSVLAVKQEAWEGLDPINRDRIAEMARQSKLTILTAQCDAGELRAEIYGGKNGNGN